jgi:hypothetical protein
MWFFKKLFFVRLQFSFSGAYGHDKKISLIMRGYHLLRFFPPQEIIGIFSLSLRSGSF